MVSMTAFVDPPRKAPWYLRPGLWLARRITGKDPLPGRLLTHFPKAAFGVGLFEMTAASARNLDARCLAIVRIVASVVGGCPFCVDMNAATWRRAGLTAAELEVLLRFSTAASAVWPTTLSQRERTAATYAMALSQTPVIVSAVLQAELLAAFSQREIVVLAVTAAQVNFWTRFNQGLGVPAAGFFDESVCKLPAATSSNVR